MSEPHLVQEFDPDLWEGGVDDGAFSGDRDPDSTWYTMKVGEEKVALASAVPGPGELTTISYYVHPDHRGSGYGTKIASRVTDLHDKATFTIFKDNEVSIKVAMNALRNKFSMTLGHNVVRLTKEASTEESVATILRKIRKKGIKAEYGEEGQKEHHRDIHITAKGKGEADRVSKILNRMGYPMEKKFKNNNRIHDIATKKLPGVIAVKAAATQQRVMLMARARKLAQKGKMPFPTQLDRAAKGLGQFSQEKMRPSQALSTMQMAGPKAGVDLERQIRRALEARLSPQQRLF